MKKAIFTFILLVTFQIVNAQPVSSQLNISSTGNYFLSVQLDGNYYSAPDNYFSFVNIIPGNHYVRIYQHFRGRYGYAQTREVFNNYLQIPVNATVDAVVQRNGRIKIYTTANCNQSYSQNHCGNGWEQDNLPYSYDNCQPVIIPNCESQVFIPMAMSSNDFATLKSSIASKAFDSTRLTIAKQVLNSAYFTSSQVLELMSLMTFESTKLDFAKSAYTRTVDRQNYFRVFDGFTFSSSIDELSQYMRTAG